MAERAVVVGADQLRLVAGDDPALVEDLGLLFLEKGLVGIDLCADEMGVRKRGTLFPFH
jgi:hypothetical protein